MPGRRAAPRREGANPTPRPRPRPGRRGGRRPWRPRPGRPTGRAPLEGDDVQADAPFWGRRRRPRPRPEQRVVDVAGERERPPASRVAHRARSRWRPSARPRRRRARPDASCTTAPSATRNPAPPSVEALPPTPRTTSRQPACDRRGHASPVPTSRRQGREAGGEPGEAPGVGHLDDRDVAPAGVRGRDRLAVGPVTSTGTTVEARRGEGGQRAVPAVGDRDVRPSDVGARAAQAPVERRGHLGRRQGALELVGGQDDPRGGRSAGRARSSRARRVPPSAGAAAGRRAP